MAGPSSSDPLLDPMALWRDAVAQWEKRHGRLTAEEMNEARRSVRAQLRTSRTVRRPA